MGKAREFKEEKIEEKPESSHNKEKSRELVAVLVADPGRFREDYQIRDNTESVPINKVEVHEAIRIITTTADRAYPGDIYTCLTLMGQWTETHPSMVTDHKTLTQLHGQALSNWRTCVKERFSDKSVVELKKSAEAYGNQYFDLLDKEKLKLADLTDVIEKNKSLGYLPYDETLKDLQKKAEDDDELGVFIGKNAHIGGCVCLFIYYIKGLEADIKKDRAVYQAADWPTNPHEFVRKAAQEVVDRKTPLFDALSNTFRSYLHPHRMVIPYSIIDLRKEIQKRERPAMS